MTSLRRRLPVYALGTLLSAGVVLVANWNNWGEIKTFMVFSAVMVCYTVFVLVPFLILEQLHQKERTNEREGSAR